MLGAGTLVRRKYRGTEKVKTELATQESQEGVEVQCKETERTGAFWMQSGSSRVDGIALAGASHGDVKTKSTKTRRRLWAK